MRSVQFVDVSSNHCSHDVVDAVNASHTGASITAHAAADDMSRSRFFASSSARNIAWNCARRSAGVDGVGVGGVVGGSARWKMPSPDGGASCDVDSAASVDGDAGAASTGAPSDDDVAAP